MTYVNSRINSVKIFYNHMFDFVHHNFASCMKTVRQDSKNFTVFT